MGYFTPQDIESLKRNGTSMENVHYTLSNTIVHSDNVMAEVKKLDRDSGRFEILLSGTISRDFIKNEK